MRTDTDSRKLAKKLSTELDELLEKENIRWRQRSRVDWLKSGDINTLYFHRKATWRAKKNRIEKLSVADGSETSDEARMNTSKICTLPMALSNLI
jgi:hypothetical protein